MPQYIRVRIYKIEDVLPFITEERTIREYGGYKVKMDSLRYHTFAKSLKCTKCDIKGEFFALEKDKYNPGNKGDTYHFNLYAIGSNGQEVLMTKDHITPKSKGGKNHISNLETLCVECNGKKDDGMEIMINMGKVDWKLLREQKLKLLKCRTYLENDDPYKWVEPISGIIHFLDNIQDQAAEQIGKKEIFGVLK